MSNFSFLKNSVSLHISGLPSITCQKHPISNCSMNRTCLCYAKFCLLTHVRRRWIGSRISIPAVFCWLQLLVQCSWNVIAHGDARVEKWRGNWRIDLVASTLHTTSEHGVSSITTADAHTSAASSRLNWRSRRFKWTRPFHWRTKSGFCACAITFQTQST